MRVAYKSVAHLIVLGVLLQAASIAWSTFLLRSEISEGAVETTYDGNSADAFHAVVGMMVIPTLAVVLLVLAFLGRAPGAVRWSGLTLLATVLQVVLAVVAEDLPAVGALHGLNAFAVLVLAFLAGRAGSPAAP